jgi:hypothetical protein
MTAPDFDGARNAIALASVESARLWLELFDLVGALERSSPQEARALVKRACDLEYDLTGACDVLGPLTDAMGYPDE